MRVFFYLNIIIYQRFIDKFSYFLFQIIAD